MAKITGGLLSENARGSIGGVITYQGRKTFRHVHRKSEPRDPQTAAQRHYRDKFASIVALWQSLSPAEKQVYEDLSPQYNNNPGYNVFLTIKLKSAQMWAKFGWVTFGMDARFGGPA